jgi:hypothetical protein
MAAPPLTQIQSQQSVIPSLDAWAGKSSLYFTANETGAN